MTLAPGGQKPAKGQCWVCGKETEHRCSSCAKEEMDVFLCSREHQKLVWPWHKRLCGEPSLLMPLFSPTEATRLKQDLPLLKVEGGVYKTTYEYLLGHMVHKLACRLEEAIDRFTMSSRSSNINQFGKQFVLAMLWHLGSFSHRIAIPVTPFHRSTSLYKQPYH
ncbi:hypothetical protein JCM8547_000569 [Rhodosporidiobolus lusitaniae]